MKQLNKEQSLIVIDALMNSRDHLNECIEAMCDEDLKESSNYILSTIEDAIRIVEDNLDE